jgi:hypothetical protein
MVTPTDTLLDDHLIEKIKQTRTQFFVYIATVIFMAVSALSITDKALLLNDQQITLPLLDVNVPPVAIFATGPIFLLVVFCNLHIHWHRLVQQIEILGIKKERLPFAVFNALYTPLPDFAGSIENLLARTTLYCLLVPAQLIFFFPGY